MSLRSMAAQLRNALADQPGFTRTPTCVSCQEPFTPPKDRQGLPLPVLAAGAVCPSCNGAPVAGATLGEEV
jgi:hypothetical protein